MNNAASEMKALVTGASGLLGRAIVKEFEANGWNVLGLAFSRSSAKLKKVDLRDSHCVEETIKSFEPYVVIHSAAERRADVVEQCAGSVQRLNVDATTYIAKTCAALKIPLIYISTNYVFDGKNPPYKPQDKPNPLNKYGLSKLAGERATLAAHPGSIVLRVPLLYGPVERINESGGTYLYNYVIQSSQVKHVCNYQQRFPTHIQDVSSVLRQMADKLYKGEKFHGLFHWSSSEQHTKYSMTVCIAKVLGLSHKHILPQETPDQVTPRPHNVQLDVSDTLALGIKVTETPFDEGIQECLKPFIKGGNLLEK
ncbi:Methionine adenosyltransferase 2 subunit beta [Holothuria leucospilota]|uniref:Methionine adenosyltransferase 2 subunit beta n=1 Tax=Holothuria leucospilota TaxID=206669 RepID=A0A9Q1BL54_HOLLE|nr:Methionine adenosyltransferase 2 subunit beta [Holothuria leucospilota]